jgi:benzoate/toluate 1,2-dioxygenase reductase subunit
MTTHKVTILFEDGRGVVIDADEANTIYLSALKSRVRIETDCLEGACATCKGLCTQGEYYLDDHSDEALSAEEAARRQVLTCQMHPKSDCVIEFPYESSLALRTEPETVPGRVTEIETVAESVVRLVVEPEAELAPFLPGQYVHLGVPGTDQRRSYSFANPPGVTDRLSFYVKVLETGAMSDYVSGRARPGDEMAITGPFGRFYLRPPVRPIVMVAGGTGLAPMLSMFDHLEETGGAGQPIRLLYGANTPGELFGLDRVAGDGLALTTELAVVAGAAGWDGHVGHVTELLRPEHVAGGDVDAYLCGPPPMIEAAEAWLLANGVEPARIHAEKYLPS